MVIYGAINTSYDTVSEADRKEFERMMERKHTEIELMGTQFGEGLLTLTIRNTGNIILHTRTLEVLLDGTWATAGIGSMTVEGTVTDIWGPGEDLEIGITTSVQPERIKIITGNGYCMYGGM